MIFAEVDQAKGKKFELILLKGNFDLDEIKFYTNSLDEIKT